MKGRDSNDTILLQRNSDTASLIVPLHSHDNQNNESIPNYHSNQIDSENIETPMNDNNTNSNLSRIPLLNIAAMLAPAFAWGFISTTLSLLTLPLESQRVALSYSSSMELELDSTLSDTNNSSTINVQDGTSVNDSTSSIFLALFIFLAGLTQWLCPIIGKISDESITIRNYWGRRIPFIIMGSLLSILSLLGMSLSSWKEQWYFYGLTFTLFMIGMNILYGCMYALIPDLIPSIQVGQANGILAMQLVLGSLSGFSLFQACIAYNHSHLSLHSSTSAVKMTLMEVYLSYALVLCCSCLLAVFHTHEQTDYHCLPTNGTKYPDTTEDQTNTFFHPTKLHDQTIQLFHLWKHAIHQASQITTQELFLSYRISPTRHGDFFFVTLSRTFYYMGISIQSFFLFYIHDILRHHSTIARESPQTIVSGLALLVQFSGAITSYPAGYVSDTYIHGERKPLIYVSCAVLSLGVFSLIWIRYLNTLEWACVFIGLANGGYLTMETSLAVDSLENMKSHYKEMDRIKLMEQQQQQQQQQQQPSSHSIQQGESMEEKKEGAAQMLGIWGVASFVGIALGPLIGGPLLFLFGKEKDMDLDDTFHDDYVGGQQYTLLGYIILFSSSALYFAFAALALRWVRDCH